MNIVFSPNGTNYIKYFYTNDKNALQISKIIFDEYNEFEFMGANNTIIKFHNKNSTKDSYEMIMDVNIKRNYSNIGSKWIIILEDLIGDSEKFEYYSKNLIDCLVNKYSYNFLTEKEEYNKIVK
jgi:hypothetical protein